MSEDGEAAIVKVGCPCWVTVRTTVVVCRIPPPLAETIMDYIPTFTEPPTVMVIVELPEPGAGIGLGLKLKVICKPG